MYYLDEKVWIYLYLLLTLVQRYKKIIQIYTKISFYKIIDKHKDSKNNLY